MNDDAIREYLAELRKELGLFARQRRRTLAEVEDHLREAAARIQQTGVPPHEAAREAAERFGSPRLLASRPSKPSPSKRQAAGIAAALMIAAGVVALSTPTSSHATIPMAGSNRVLPGVIRSPALGAGPEPGTPIPAGTRIDATAPVSTASTYVFTTYTWRGRQCETEYLATRGSLVPPPGHRGAGSSCQPPGSSRPAMDLQIQGGSGQPFILSGTVPQAADQLAITTAGGRRHIFSLPHIPIHTDRHRQAVIIDLIRQHIRSVVRLALLSHGRTLASERQGAA